jgi:hypothetical protein
VIKLGDTVKINNSLHKLHGLEGKIIEIDEKIYHKTYGVCNRIRYYKVSFTGKENCLAAGFSVKWTEKFKDIGFTCTFEEEHIEII